MVYSLFHLATRLFPVERGKFRILSEVYFRYIAPKKQTFVFTKLSFGIRMRLDITEFLQAHLYLFGSYELPTVRFIRNVLKTGDTAFDVGAQIGYLTLAMSTASGGQIRVVSFEPESHNAERLRSNIALNPGVDVTIVEKAASNVEGVLRLYLSHDHNSGTHSTIPNGVNVSNEYIEIPSTTLDAYIAEHSISELKLVKIDVEGGELEVIRGAEKMLRNLRPIIIMELSDSLQAARGFTTVEFKNLMLTHQYQSYTIRDNGMLTPSPMDAQHAMDNVVFIHDSNKEELRSMISA